MGKFRQSQIKTLFDIQAQNDLKLRSESTPRNPKVNPIRFKKPRTLYDSGWITCTGSGDPEFRPVCVPDDFDAYGQLEFYESQTSLAGKKIPMNFYYRFMRDVHIPERLVPFVNASFMIKCPPAMEPIGVDSYKMVGWGDNYYEIHAGGNLVYKGSYPFTYYFSDTEINRGDLPRANCSKWYEGVIEYTDGGDHYQIYGDLQYIGVYYNTVYVAGPNSYNFKYFFTQTFDNIYGSSVNGQGNEQSGTWKETEPGSHNWYLDYSDNIHEVHRAVNIFGAGNTVIVAINGAMFKNGERQAGYNWWLKTTGNYQSGTATITSWSFAHKTVYDDTNDKLYKLHYSSRRLRQLMISSYPEEYVLTNLPSSDDINSGSSLPFTSAHFKVNPNPYPLSREESYNNFENSSQKKLWAKVSGKDAKNETWRFFTEGNQLFFVPATLNIGYKKPYVDENYTYNGYGFQRDQKNRPDKTMPAYVPDTHTIQMRLVLSLENPAYYQGIQRYS